MQLGWGAAGEFALEKKEAKQDCPIEESIDTRMNENDNGDVLNVIEDEKIEEAKETFDLSVKGDLPDVDTKEEEQEEKKAEVVQEVVVVEEKKADEVVQEEVKEEINEVMVQEEVVVEEQKAEEVQEVKEEAEEKVFE